MLLTNALRRRGQKDVLNCLSSPHNSKDYEYQNLLTFVTVSYKKLVRWTTSIILSLNWLPAPTPTIRRRLIFLKHFVLSIFKSLKMKIFFLLFLAVQLSIFTISVAQITFTREWVTGKRSIAPKVKVVMHDEDQSFCRSLLPAIDFLLEAEKAREKICGPTLQAIPHPFIWNRPLQQNEIPNSLNSGQPMDFANTFEGNVASRIRKSA